MKLLVIILLAVLFKDSLQVVSPEYNTSVAYFTGNYNDCSHMEHSDSIFISSHYILCACINGRVLDNFRCIQSTVTLNIQKKTHNHTEIYYQFHSDNLHCYNITNLTYTIYPSLRCSEESTMMNLTTRDPLDIIVSKMTQSLNTRYLVRIERAVDHSMDVPVQTLSTVFNNITVGNETVNIYAIQNGTIQSATDFQQVIEQLRILLNNNTDTSNTTEEFNETCSNPSMQFSMSLRTSWNHNRTMVKDALCMLSQPSESKKTLENVYIGILAGSSVVFCLFIAMMGYSFHQRKKYKLMKQDIPQQVEDIIRVIPTIFEAQLLGRLSLLSILAKRQCCKRSHKYCKKVKKSRLQKLKQCQLCTAMVDNIEEYKGCNMSNCRLIFCGDCQYQKDLISIDDRHNDYILKINNIHQKQKHFEGNERANEHQQKNREREVHLTWNQDTSKTQTSLISAQSYY